MTRISRPSRIFLIHGLVLKAHVRPSMQSPPNSPTYSSKYEHKLDDDEDQQQFDDSLDVSMEEPQEEELLFGGDNGEASTPEEQRFDAIVGCLEEVLMNPEFQLRQDQFCEMHCSKFFNDEENRLEYMPLFQEYSTLIETFIAEKLTECISGFSMEEFQDLLENHEGEICGDIFDLLLSLSDFQEFKDTMLSYKAAAEGKMFKSSDGGDSEGAGTMGVGVGGDFFNLAPVVTPFSSGMMTCT